MNASEIPLGFGFVGTVERQLWNFAGHRHFDGRLIRVALLLPESYEPSDGLLMDFMSSLRWDNVLQVSSPGAALWVHGVRPKRSRFVRIHGWSHAGNTGAGVRVLKASCLPGAAEAGL